MSKITEAIEKINTEVNESDKPGQQAIGEYLIDTITEATGTKIMAPGKTLSGCYQHLFEIAQKNQKNRVYCFSSPDEINNYFGITPEDQKPGATITAINPAPAQSMNIDLMSLL